MASLKKSLNDYLKNNKSKSSKGGSDIFSTFLRSKFKSQKEPDGKKTGDGGGGSASLTKDSSVFLKIIAKNSIALPGMAKDVNILRQNVVKLVKLKTNDKKGASAKADKFFKTEDQREAELEESRKKQDSKVMLMRDNLSGNKKPDASKDDDGGIIKWLGSKAKEISQLLFWGIITAVSKAVLVGIDIATWFKEHFKPTEWIESLFKSISDGWKIITETDIVKESLIKGLGKLLEFITFGMFGEKQLRENLKSLSDNLQPIITLFTEMFDRVANWMSENIGWDKFTIPLSKYGFDIPLPATLVSVAAKLGINLSDKIPVSFPDITIPGFRPFSKRERIKPATKKSSGNESSPAIPTKSSTYTDETTSPSQLAQNQTENNTNKTPSKESSLPATIKTKEDALKILDEFDVKPDAQSPTGFSTKQGTPVEEPLLRSALMAQGIDGNKIISLVKSPSTPKPESASPITNSMDIKLPSEQTSGSSGAGNTGSVGAPSSNESGSDASNISPTPENSSESITPKSSGSQLGKLSGDVSEGQRLDSAPDIGTVVNSSTVNNNKGSIGKDSAKTSDVYDTEFVQNYLQPSAG